MNLEDVRRELRERAGAVKAFALRWTTVESLVDELGVKGTRRSPFQFFPGVPPTNVTIFDVPVIVVTEDQPEGVIV